MTIKITQQSTTTGEIVLTITFDNPKGSGTMQTYILRKDAFYSRLSTVAQLLGRSLTVIDAQQVLIEIIKEVRAGLNTLPPNFDFAPFIGQELEPAVSVTLEAQ